MPTYKTPTPRQSKDNPSTVSVVLFVLLVGTLMSLSIWFCITHRLPTEAELRPAKTATPLTTTHTYDGNEKIRWYVMVDPDTSVQYLVNDHGGCQPRLDKYGNVIGVQKWVEGSNG